MQNAVTLLIGGDQPAACGQLLVVPELEEGLDQALPGDSVCLASQGPHQVYRSTVLDVFLVIDFWDASSSLTLSFDPVIRNSHTCCGMVNITVPCGLYYLAKTIKNFKAKRCDGM